MKHFPEFLLLVMLTIAGWVEMGTGALIGGLLFVGFGAYLLYAESHQKES